MTVFVSRPEHVTVHDRGWHRLPSGVEVTRLPLWDEHEQLFARLSWEEADALCRARGWRLPTVAELDALHADAAYIEPYTLPTAAMVRAAGIALDDEQMINRFRATHMSGRPWCLLHDTEVLRRLPLAGGSGVAVSNAGKHWCAEQYGIYGWWRADGTVIQPLYTKHRNQRDYATTTHAARDTDTCAPPDTERPERPRTTRLGERGSAVRAWQDYLLGADYELPRYGADGHHGTETETATEAWQRDHAMTPPPASWRDQVAEYIQARNYTRAGRPLDSIRWIVLHSTENPVRAGVARSVARWFGGPSAPRASAHFVVGPDEVIQCVALGDVAWAAPGANRHGIQIEMVGRAAMTDWLAPSGDRGGRPVMERTARLVAALCRALDLPMVTVDPAGLVAGERGVTTHASVTAAKLGDTTHQDPGLPGDRRWPWPEFWAVVERG